MSNNGVVSSYTMSNGMNQYTNIGGLGVDYDGNFNLKNFNGMTFTYDAANQLVGGSMQCTYDGLGRCVRRTTQGGTRLFTYDGWKPILEWVGWGGWLAWNVYGAGADEILARYDWAGRISIYKQDKQGSVVALLDGSGNVAEKYRYDAFGQPTVSDYWGNVRTDENGKPVSWCDNRFMFTGREWITELGIYDYRHRYYHPGLGRFLQTDPIGFDAGDINLFRYCGDDPVDRSDPTGLIWSSEGYETVRDFSRIPNVYIVRDWQPYATGVTLQRFWIDAEPVKLANGKYAIEYHDAEMRSHSYIRNHFVKPYTGEQWDRCPEQMQRTRNHEGEQQNIDKRVYDRNEEAIRKDVKSGTYGSYNDTKKAIAQKEAKWKGILSNERAAEGKKLQARDGYAPESPNCDPSGSSGSAPSAKDVDLNHQRTGVPGLGAEAVNHVNGRL